MAEDPQHARLLTIARLLNELVAYQSDLVRQLRTVRMAQRRPIMRPRGETPLPHPTKRDYDYFTELEQRLSELANRPDHHVRNGNGSAVHS